jgi:hypothetical protein
VAVVDAATELVEIANVADVAPCGTVTFAGTVADTLLLDRDTTIPPAGAGPLSVAVPWAAEPPLTEVGLTETADKDAVAAGNSVRFAETVVPPPDTEIVTTVALVTGWVRMLNPPLVDP